MSFKRLDPEDIVISADSITAPAWTGNATQLTAFYTSSNQRNSISGDYYFNVYNAAVGTGTEAIQFSVGYGHRLGSGSAPLNSTATLASYTPSRIVYGQYRTLVNGTEDTDLTFGTYTPNSIYAISVERARFKEKLFPGSLSLSLSKNGNTVKLTDNSNYTTTETFTDAGRVYEIISGSAGTRTSSPKDSGSLGYTPSYGSYGLFLPDAGLLLLNGDALDQGTGGGGISLGTSTGNTDGENPAKLIDAMNLGDNFVLRSEETISSNYVFIRARNSEFNYSTNPSNITGSGELTHNIMIDSPQAYITAVGLYNDNNDLLAVAKLSRPLLKDFTKEALIRIKLDY